MSTIYELIEMLKNDKGNFIGTSTWVTRNIPNPDGKVSKKSGEVIKVSQCTKDLTAKGAAKKDATWLDLNDTYALTFRSREYNALKLGPKFGTDEDGNRVQIAEAIVPKQLRWLEATPEQIEVCERIRGKLALTEIVLDSAELLEKCRRKVANAMVKLDEEDVDKCSETSSNFMLQGLDLLKGVQEKADLDVAF